MSRISHVSAGLTAVIIGYTSSVAIVIQAAKASGVNTEQLSSWLLVLGLIMGISSIALSWRYKMPILMAWSTPGAVILASAPFYTLPTLIGAFIFAGALISLTGMISPLKQRLSSIPDALAAAMLGAIILPFCFRSFAVLGTEPLVFLSMLAIFLLVKCRYPSFAITALLCFGVLYAFYIGSFENIDISLQIATLVPVLPEFSMEAIINVGVPLYLVTMLSQNLPGFALLRSYNYSPPVKPILIASGFINTLSAPFGGFSLNLAAISAAVCMNETVDSAASQRYKAVLWAGVFYIIAGIWAGAVVAIFLALPTVVTTILAGFALIGTFQVCMKTAFTESRLQGAAAVTFLMTASGVTFLGGSAVIWGLLIGILWLYVEKNKGAGT